MPNSVRFYDSTMSGAPALSGTAGALIGVLDGCLVDGFGSVTVNSLVVASNVATATVSAGHQFAMIGNTGPVIRIEGATPSGLNGDWRVTVTGATTFTFATTGISDQTATGMITAKRAPAGFEKAQGIISAFYLKDPNDEEWASDEGVRGYFAWMKSDFPDGDAADLSNVYGYTTAQTIVRVLTQCGNDLSRENIMRQAENLNFPLPLLLPGSKITTSATDHYPIEKFQMAQFDKERWKLMPA